MSVYVCVCVCVNNGSIHLKLEHIVVQLGQVQHWGLSDQGQGHGVTEIFSHLPQYKLSSPLSQLWHILRISLVEGLNS